MQTLPQIVDTLRARYRDVALPYRVPGLWVDGRSVPAQAVNPYEFYSQRLASIIEAPPQPLTQAPPGEEWSRRALVYNLFPRVSAAFDHAGEGRLRIDPRPDGWRDTGTLLKAIVLLPYIRSMGFDTVHLLPITAVGQDGKKGTLGSPYAIRNAYRLDENLAEPALDLSAEVLFRGFVEAAHHLGMRVVMEFVLRTASKDADWIGEHPEWFYWIREDVPDRPVGSLDPHAYGSPLFDPDTLALIKSKVGAGDFRRLPPPPKVYRDMFTPPPRREQVRQVEGRWVGTLDDGTRVRIPGAFTDWPPDDGQPPWTDVTYLRLYDHPNFNYIAYNTLRMYDERLARPEHANMPLWDAIAGVIPYYQGQFGIDGVMLDMGHALPMPLKRRMVEEVRRLDPDFAFWEENFAISMQSRNEGYNAVVGHMVFDLHHPQALRNFVHRLASEVMPIPFFATAENHNTPRAAARNGNGVIYSYYTLPFCIAVPGIPFVHSGFELGETQPINTGLGFTPEMLARYPAEKLPLFSEWAFDWTRKDNLIAGVSHALRLRRQYEDVLSANDPSTWRIGASDNPHILVFTRKNGSRALSFIANTDMEAKQRGRAMLGGRNFKAQGLWGTPDALPVYHGLGLTVELSPGYVLILDAQGLPLEGC